MSWSYRIIGTGAFILFSSVFVFAEGTKDAKDLWDNYKIISEKNIFSRSRTKAVPVSEVKEPVIVVPEQTYYTLRGITKQNDELVSFVEDSRAMTVKKVRKGERVGPGKVSDITLDEVSYVNGRNTLKVKIGMDLEGHTSSSGGQYYSARSNAFPGNAQAQPTGQAPGMGQAQGNAQFSGMGQQGMGQQPSAGQFPSMGQGAGQNNAMGQTQSMPQRTGQMQPTGQAPTGQTQTATKTVTKEGQTDQGSGDVLQRLKERRKKEMEE